MAVHPLILHIRKALPLDAETAARVLGAFTPVKVKKKEMLQQEGRKAHQMYFVVKGCLRMFFIDDKGLEHTTQFALEHWWMADHMALLKQAPAEFSIQAVEGSDLMVISYSDLEKLLSQLPALERYFRWVYQRAYAAAQMRVKIHAPHSKEILYRQFAAQYPEFIQRVPQYLLASFLGFTPEYLSELRRKSLS